MLYPGWSFVPGEQRREIAADAVESTLGCLGCDIWWSDDVRRKIPQVHRNDDIWMAANSSRPHVPVVWIGELQTGNQILVAGHERIDCVLVHQDTGAFQLVAGEVRPLLKQIGNSLLMNVRRPFRTKQPNERQVHEVRAL